MLSIEEGKLATTFARYIVEQSVKNKKILLIDFEKIVNKKYGVFVTLHTFPSYELRGCIGIPQSVMSLKNALIEAGKSVIKDPRFQILEENELNKIIIEITVLTEPELIKVDHPKDYLSSFQIGIDGLIVEKGSNSGLLLPQVPIEQNWTKEEFISNTCVKAWLPPKAWLLDKINIYKFKGQIFSEIEPKGEIKEKNLNGTNN